MSRYQKVIWYEGMNLDPHHFQQWDRYFHASLFAHTKAVRTHNWGFLEYEINKDALYNGLFTLEKCSGITPDGLIFDCPAKDPLPSQRSIQDQFQPAETSLGIYLVIPAEHVEGGNYQINAKEISENIRFSLKKVSVGDENRGAESREIGVARLNLQIKFDNEPLEDFVLMKIAKVIRSSEGEIVIDDEFIPPCLTLAASPRLQNINRGILELIVAKANSLTDYRIRSDQNSYTPMDIKNILLLNSLHGSIPILKHYFSSPKSHPEDLYLALLSIAGQISFFSPDFEINPQELPDYDHNNLSHCFNQLEKTVRKVLGEWEAKEKCITIPLEKRSETMQIGQVTDPGLLQTSKFFLQVSGDMPEQKVISEIPENIRIASPDTINAVLASFSRALLLNHISKPPSGLPVAEDTQYFRLEQTGRYWEAICQSQAFAIFVPSEFVPLKYSLIAI